MDHKHVPFQPTRNYCAATEAGKISKDSIIKIAAPRSYMLLFLGLNILQFPFNVLVLNQILVFADVVVCISDIT